MTRTAALRAALGSLLALRPERALPLSAHLGAATLLAVIVPLGLMSLVALFGRIDWPNWWWASLLPNIGICLCIAYTLLAVLRLAPRWLPQHLVARMADLRDVRAGVAWRVLALGTIVLGAGLGLTLVPALFAFDLSRVLASLPVALAKFACFLVFVLALNWAWWRARLRREELAREASEARLRLLQGQMEPHLMFNTLANIQSLMDADPARAKQMLETFSDYLRAGLSQLRQGDSTLGAELEMAERYLSLMGIRMASRLRFRIDSSADARVALMPTLMLQPLVENAIHHGIEPKLDGGSVTITACVQGARLRVSVTDDGVGLDTPSRRLRRGAGMALVNLRARLHSQFGDRASLTLQARDGTTVARLELPYLPAPAARGNW